LDAKNLGEIPTTSPPTEAQNRGGVGSNRRFLTNIVQYLRNGTSSGHSYYGRLIGIYMCSIEWRYAMVAHNHPKAPHFLHIATSFIFS